MNSPHDPQQSESDSSTPAVEPKPKRSRFAALESLLDAAASGAVVSEPAVPAPPPPAAPPPAEPPPTVAPRKFAMGVEMQVVSRLPSESKPATPSIVTEQPILESASRPGSLAAVLAAVVDDADQPVPTTHRGSDSGVPESPAALPQQPPPVIRNEEPSPSASRGLPGERVVVDGGPAAARQEPRPPVEHSPLVAGAPLAGESIPAGPVALQAVVETAVLDAGIPTIGTRREGDPGTPESPVMRPHQPSAIVRGEEPSAGASRGLPGERVVVDGSPAAARQEPRPPVGVAPAVAHAPPLGGSIPSTSLPSGGSAGASSSRDTFSDSQPSRSPAAVTSPAPGLFRDVSTLKENGSLTLVELREFLARLKGRSPQEVIGIVSTSLLIRSLLLATFATAAILAVFTVGPYFVYGPVNQPKVSPAKAAAAAAAELAREQPNKSAPSETANADGSGTPDVERAAKAMGLDETKTADPKKNPLDGPDFDKLLDGK